jgi:hypothetical protein
MNYVTCLIHFISSGVVFFGPGGLASAKMGVHHKKSLHFRASFLLVAEKKRACKFPGQMIG